MRFLKDLFIVLVAAVFLGLIAGMLHDGLIHLGILQWNQLI
jgi:hypothetical protein